MFRCAALVFTSTILVTQCNSLKNSLRIIGGTDASTGEYPYVVRLEYQIMRYLRNNTIIARHVHQCTAAVVTSKWTLTAGHCTMNCVTDIKQYEDSMRQHGMNATVKCVIRYGHVLHSPWVNDTFSNILSIIMHNSFETYQSLADEVVLKNDVALLETEPILIDRYIKISGVDYTSIVGHEVTIVGYGLTNRTYYVDNVEQVVIDDTLNFKTSLQMLKALLVKCEKDRDMYPKICVVKPCHSPASTCPGDSGAPVLHISGVVGLISSALSYACKITREDGRRNLHTEVTPISPYIDWINSIINQNNILQTRN